MAALREQQRRDKWRRILAAARMLFAERGYDGTTVRDIAREAGVATGTVLHYGATKAALLHEVWREEAMPVFEAALARAPRGTSLADELVDLLGPLLDHYAADRRLARIVVKELPYLEGEARDAHAPLLDLLVGALAAALARAVARGEVRDDLPVDVGVRLLLSVYQLVLVEMLAPAVGARASEARAALRRYVEELVAGFSRRS